MSYAQYTRTAFTTELAVALGDPNHTYWALDELERALNEALLYWGALTSYWTNSGTLSTVAGTTFYDLSVELSSLRTRAYTFGNVMKEIQYRIFEPASGVAGGGTGATAQFTLSQITDAIARHRNQFVLDSRVPLSTATISAASPPTSTLSMTDATALVSRAQWTETATGIVTPLRRTDTWAAKSLAPLWNLNPGKPYGFSQVEAMPGNFLLIPPAQRAGSMQIVYAATQTLTVADATTLQVPDEFALAVSYGALYEVLSTNSQGYDPIRTKYCLERYTAAVEAAKMHRSIIEVRSNGTPLGLTTLAALDAGKPTWGTGRGAPQLAACAYDQVAFYRVPDRAYTITCNVSQTAPLPASGGAYIQVGQEELGYLMDYCRHILQIKVGGVEFVQSMPLYDNFLKGAAQRNKLIAAKARYLTPLFSQPGKEEQENPAA